MEESRYVVALCGRNVGRDKIRETKDQEGSFGGNILIQYFDVVHDFMGFMSIKTWYVYIYVKTYFMQSICEIISCQ